MYLLFDQQNIANDFQGLYCKTRLFMNVVKFFFTILIIWMLVILIKVP